MSATLIWLGVGLISGGAAILLDAPQLYCKSSSGIINPLVWIWMGGWLLVYRGIWILKPFFRKLGLAKTRENERDFDVITSRLFLGKLLWELPRPQGQPEVDMVVDTTCEWSEPAALRSVKHYVQLLCVDTTRPEVASTVDVALRIVAHLEKPDLGSIYVHCANGYGRSAIVAAAVLVLGGYCKTAQDAIDQVKAARPVVSFRPGIKRAMCETMTHEEMIHKIAEIGVKKAEETSDEAEETSDEARAVEGASAMPLLEGKSA